MEYADSSMTSQLDRMAATVAWVTLLFGLAAFRDDLSALLDTWAFVLYVSAVGIPLGLISHRGRSIWSLLEATLLGFIGAATVRELATGGGLAGSILGFGLYLSTLISVLAVAQLLTIRWSRRGREASPS